MTTLLVDGDILAYQAAAASEHPIQWDENLWTLHSDLREAKKIFTEKSEEIRDHLPARDMILCLTPRDTFRYRLWPQYKASRKTRRRPLVLEPLREWIRTEHRAMERPDIEADDVIGICATSPYIVKGEKIVVSIDKDLRTIPCVYARIDDWQPEEITVQQADRNHMLQTLTGDPTDGYPGCPKTGPKAAEKILDGLTGYEQMWPAVLAAYQKAGQTAEQALTMARLARICRREDYDFANRHVIYWIPKGE